jgi:hypothetical protein
MPNDLRVGSYTTLWTAWRSRQTVTGSNPSCEGQGQGQGPGQCRDFQLMELLHRHIILDSGRAAHFAILQAPVQGLTRDLDALRVRYIILIEAGSNNS